MIETARLVLRPLEDGDRDWAAAQVASAEIMEYLGGPQTRAESDKRIDRMMRWQEEHGFSFHVMLRKADGVRIGLCGLKYGEPESSVAGEHEIGWRLGAAYQGQGYAREAAAAMLAFAFDSIGAPHVVAVTSERNAASWGLMRRLGMTRRLELDYQDPKYPPDDNPAIVHRITAEEWRA